MAVIPYVTVDDPNGALLSKRAAEVKDDEFNTEELRTLVQDISDAKEANGCVGMSGPNLGVDKRIIIIGVDAEKNEQQAYHDKVESRVVINPLLTTLDSKKIWGTESCLSVPGVRALVPRHKTVRCTGRTVEGTPLEFIVSGYASQILQHEADHLDGILFPSRVEKNKALWARALFPMIMYYDMWALNRASEQKMDPDFFGPGILFEKQKVAKKYRRSRIILGAYFGALWNLDTFNQWNSLGGVSKELLAIGVGAVVVPVLMFNAIGLREGTRYALQMNDFYKKASAQITSTKVYKKASAAYRSCGFVRRFGRHEMK
jgi:peptide deformylase